MARATPGAGVGAWRRSAACAAGARGTRCRPVRLPAPPWIFAHRGALPLLENTLPALLLAVEEGADLLEFDVQSTADGVLVVHHDFGLGRLAGRPDLAVEDATLAELAALDLRHPDHPERTGRIPTLAGLLAALPSGFPVNIELKVSRSARGRLAELALAATAGRENVLFSSFDTDLLGELRRRSTTADLAPLAKRWTPGLERLGASSRGLEPAHRRGGRAGRGRCGRPPRGAAARGLHGERRRSGPGAARAGRRRPVHRPAGGPASGAWDARR